MKARSPKNSQRALAPLTAEEFRKARINVRRHKPVARPITAATFNIISDLRGQQPAVSTRIVPARASDRQARWHVEVTLDSGKVVPPVVQPVRPRILKRSVLQRARKNPLYPSMPDDGSKFVKRPPLSPPRQSFRLRHGDLEYQPTTIFKPDGRGSYSDLNYPWRCLCRIQTPMGAGSGVLIGPQHALTASHVIDWTPGWCTVGVFQQNTTFLDSANATLAYASTQIGPGRIGASDGNEDYAVLVLDRRLGDTYGWYGSRTYDSGWDDEVSVWCNIGYPTDNGWNSVTPVFQTNFFLSGLAAEGSARLIRSQTFDNWPGQSGGPVFGFWDDGPYVVGVVSGQGPDYNYISGGSLLPSLISRARSEMP
jgi:V8-like Glu-specific endopeptidase